MPVENHGDPAVLFDVDGTLVDSNYAHIHAWARALRSEHISMPAWRVHQCIGMDGDTLLAALCGDAADDVLGRVKERHSQFYRESTDQLEPLPGARELLKHVAHLGLQVVLATSAPEDELAILRDILDSDDVVAAVTSASDVHTAKPQPDIIAVATERAGVDASDAVFIGDTAWDAKACVRAGVDCIGLLSGGIGSETLTAAGVSMVFDDPQHLLDNLESTAIMKLAATGGRTDA